MKFYAMTDSFTGDNPAEFTSGFANTKEPLSFDSKAAREDWLKETRLLTARALTRLDALQLSRERGDFGFIREYGQTQADFECDIYGTRNGVPL